MVVRKRLDLDGSGLCHDDSSGLVAAVSASRIGKISPSQIL